MSRAEAARTGGVTRQIVRDWVERFNKGGPDALIARKAPGKPPLQNSAQRAALAQVIEDGPLPAIDSVLRWRLLDLAQWVFETFRISISRQTFGRELRAMSYRKLSARPRHHAQAAGAVEAFEKMFPTVIAGVACTRGLDPSDIEVWFSDEASIGQKNGWYPTAPFVTPVCPTIVDPTLAPLGKHVVNLFGGHAPHTLRNGDWALERPTFEKSVLDTVERSAPGLTSDIIAHQTLLPRDIE